LPPPVCLRFPSSFQIRRPAGTTLFPYTTLFRSEEELDHVNAAILGMRHRRFERLVMLAGQIAQRLRRHRQAQTDQYHHGQSANTGQSPHAVSEPWSQNAGAGHQMRPDSTSTVLPACASLTSSASDRKSTRLNSSHVSRSYAV